MVFKAGFLELLEIITSVVARAVCARREAAVLSWKRLLHEDVSSRHYRWLRPDLVPPAPYLVCDPFQTPGGSGVLVQP